MQKSPWLMTRAGEWLILKLKYETFNWEVNFSPLAPSTRIWACLSFITKDWQDVLWEAETSGNLVSLFFFFFFVVSLTNYWMLSSQVQSRIFILPVFSLRSELWANCVLVSHPRGCAPTANQVLQALQELDIKFPLPGYSTTPDFKIT